MLVDAGLNNTHDQYLYKIVNVLFYWSRGLHDIGGINFSERS